MTAVFDSPIHTTTSNFDRVLAAGRPSLLVFEAPNCGPCRTLSATLKDIARDYAGRMLVVQVEDAQAGNLVARFRLSRAPTLVYWRDGREVTRLEGAVDSQAVRAHVDYMIGGGPRPASATGPSISLQAGLPPRESPTDSAQGSFTREGAPVVVTDSTFESEVLKSALPVLVDFWAPWCGPCRMVSPIVEELGREYAGRLRVAKVNTDENPANAGRLGIMGIPTLIIFKNGKEVERIVGAMPKPTIQTRVDRALA